MQVGPVAGRLDEEHLLDERQHVCERRPRLRRRQQHNAGVVGAEPDLVLGEDHPVGDLAAHRASLEREPARQHRAREGDADRGPDAEVPGAADDRARLRLAEVDARELEPVGVRVPLGGEDPADAEEREVAGLVGNAVRLDPLDLGRRHREAGGELGQGHLERDVVAQPGDGHPHQNCLSTRRSPSQRARMSGMS